MTVNEIDNNAGSGKFKESNQVIAANVDGSTKAGDCGIPLLNQQNQLVGIVFGSLGMWISIC